MKHRKFIRIFSLWMLTLSLWWIWGNKILASEDVVIVIDPGHGGDNLGAQWQREDYRLFEEKGMTLVTAQAMKKQLEQYENVTVYLTREEDKELSLKERVEIAESYGADALICLHYNMSISHILYGAEVWIPSEGELHATSASLATEFMNEFTTMGLFPRGIKTRIGEDGTDYYGILRISAEKNLPVVLVEHCHLDEMRDYAYYDSNETLETFGIRDAEAVAKYFGLHSIRLGVDYSNYQRTDIPIPLEQVLPDDTPPDRCTITLDSYDATKGEVMFSIEGSDADSSILYYTYSYDGGKTFVPLEAWQEGVNQVSFQVPLGTIPTVVAKIYNGYDRSSSSNTLILPQYKPEDEVPVMKQEFSFVEEVEQENQKIIKGRQILNACLELILIIVLLLGATFVTALLYKKRRKK